MLCRGILFACANVIASSAGLAGPCSSEVERVQAGESAARQLVELQYQKGAASLLEYLDAQRTYVAVKGEYIQNLTAYWNAIFQIESATATEVVQ